MNKIVQFFEALLIFPLVLVLFILIILPIWGPKTMVAMEYEQYHREKYPKK